jgi:DNA-binding SARP family transcriptional activator
MFRLRMLGPLDLSGSDHAPHAEVLRQPKRAALLVYLASVRRGGFHRRDTLLAAFWPEFDTERARDALNTAVGFLRRALGAEAIVSRGAEELGIADGAGWSDVAEFERLLGERRWEEAVEQVRGDFLLGFHAGDAPGFQEWADTERQRLRDLTVFAIRSLTDEAASVGNGPLALTWARRAVALLPDDERSVRRLIEVQHGIGDTAGALRAYDDFAARLKREFGTAPSHRTREAIERVRRGEPPAAPLFSGGVRLPRR